MCCVLQSSQQEERGIRKRQEKPYALHGPGVDMGGFLSTQTPFPWETPPQFSGLGVGGLSCGAHPHCHPKHRVGLRPRQAQQCTPSILLQCPLRQTRQTWDIWWDGTHQESEALIQWASLAMWITSERGGTRGQREAKPAKGSRARDGEQERRHSAP